MECCQSSINMFFAFGRPRKQVLTAALILSVLLMLLMFIFPFWQPRLSARNMRCNADSWKNKETRAFEKSNIVCFCDVFHGSYWRRSFVRSFVHMSFSVSKATWAPGATDVAVDESFQFGTIFWGIRLDLDIKREKLGINRLAKHNPKLY
jgi:hypothetical protein